ncbi:MAG: valine--tRNA ligase [Bacteroidales bacterium]|nr:valine--tRNA ligase [Candidatus Cacconaster merdequi]
MELPVKYDPSLTEDKWYSYWTEHKFFHSEPDGREPYTIVIPPPNVTGVLHMGHMMNNTLQDVLVRRARMKGRNALWVPGTDHASIATEAKVVNKLATMGIRKRDLTRDEFLKYAWEWKEEHGGIILKQLRRLGASCDWDRTAFTMDEVRSESVMKVFVDLYRKGLIYRGLRMVNWDPKAQTVLSTEEVVYRDEKSKLFYLRYYVADSDVNAVKPTGEEGEVLHKDEEGRYYAVVATTRPETIMGDTAMCVNPKDPKNQWLRGHKVIVPLVGRVIPVIEDRYVDIEFGTGCLKVTPAHDVNDYNLGKTHNLETIDIFNPDGTLSEAAGLYVGLDRMVVRKQIAKDLEAAGLMEKIEDYENKVGYSERNPDTAVEPRLCKQWFLSMKHFADIALPPVLEGKIKFHPSKYVSTYRNWLENIQDWCISRQLWWGPRIPAYFLPTAEGEEEKFVVALTPEEALEEARKIEGYAGITIDQLSRDEDALDTWFSSWLWPVSLFDGINTPGNREIKYYYPTNDLVTGPDIIFFWVARMIMAGEEYMNDVPFRNVYFTGIVRDKLGRKMSKQLGNSPDPIGLIEKYGADGVRLGILLCTSAGNDILFDESQVELGRNFSNKVWNAFRLVQGWKVEEKPQGEESRKAVEWFEAKLDKVMAQVDDDFSKFRINDAVMAIYKCFWDDFCAWYLEIVKPAFVDGVQQAMDKATYDATIGFFDSLLKVLHPVMPFITEELWQNIAPRKEGETIMLQMQPQAKAYDQRLIDDFDVATEAITAIRAIRQQKNISPKTPLRLQVKQAGYPLSMNPVISKMANISEIEILPDIDTSKSGQAFMVGTVQFYVPLEGMVDTEEEKAKILAEIARYEGFLKGVNAKLSNERFVANAPAQVVELERKKLSDATTKIANLKEQLEKL